MSQFDTMYLDLCERILKDGIRTEARNGITYRVPGNYWIFDLSKEFPILTTKKVAFKTSVLEIMWIYLAKTSNIKWLQERKINIWNKFQIDEDGVYRNPDTGETKFYGKEWAGTAGSTYGFLIGHGGTGGGDQMDEAIYKILYNPTDRRNIITMWLPQFFDKAVLPPCVYKVQWLVLDGTLHSFVEQRSCDVAVGVPFNISQYAALTCMLANATGLKPGCMHYNMVDVHIYEEHIENIKEQISRKDQALPAPKLWINPEIKDFYAYDTSIELKDIKLIDYKHLEKLDFVVKA